MAARSTIVARGLAALVGALDGFEVVGQRHTLDGPGGPLADVDLAVVEASPLEPTPTALDTPTLLLLDRTPADRGLLRLFAGPVRGVALLDSPEDVLQGAVRAVAAGHWFADPRLVRSLVLLASLGSREGPRPFGLTPQEQRLVALLPRGLNNIQLATELGVSVETVKTHLRAALAKLGAYDRAHAADLAERGGLA